MPFPVLIELSHVRQAVMADEGRHLTSLGRTGKPLRRGPLPWGTVRWHSTYGLVLVSTGYLNDCLAKDGTTLGSNVALCCSFENPFSLVQCYEYDLLPVELVPVCDGSDCAGGYRLLAPGYWRRCRRHTHLHNTEGTFAGVREREHALELKTWTFAADAPRGQP